MGKVEERCGRRESKREKGGNSEWRSEKQGKEAVWRLGRRICLRWREEVGRGASREV